MAVKRKLKVKRKKLSVRQMTYQSWNNMLQRCYNPKHVSYAEYGGRGIRVSTRWTPLPWTQLTRLTAFEQFMKDVGPRLKRSLTLDRLDANGNYVKSNVKWATSLEQGSNKRTTHYVRHPKTGAKIAAAYLARERNVTYQYLRLEMIREGTWFVETFSDVPLEEQPLPKQE